MQRTALLLLSAVLAACGGSGAAPATNSGPEAGTVLLLDPSAGSEESLDGRLLVVALERADGSFTQNLLERETECTFADPLGAPVVLALRDVPAGTFVAARLLLARGSFARRDRDGRRDAVDIERDDCRVAFEDPFEHRPGVRDWIELRHRGNLSLVRGSGRPLWRPDLLGRPGRRGAVQGFRVVVTSGDAGARLIHALARANPGPGNVPVTLRIAEDAVLASHREHRLLTMSEFFLRAVPGMELRVRGTIDGTFTFLVTAAEVRDQGRRGEAEHEVLGRIDALGDGETFRFQMLRVRRGGTAAPGLPLVTVDATDAFVHAGGGHHRRLAFEDLRAGMLVLVEWDGAFEQDPIPARDVEIAREDGCAQPEIEGAVRAVDVPAGTLTIGPRRDDALVVGGRRVESAVVRLGPGTLLFRDDRRREPIGLEQVGVGERIWVRGIVLTDGSVAGTWVRVREER